MLIDSAQPMEEGYEYVNECEEIRKLKAKAFNHFVDMYPKDTSHSYENNYHQFKISSNEKEYILTLCGIKEDFRVHLDEKLVCECIYGELYKENLVLLRLLFT